jgi:hypothetical protein
MTNTRQIQPKQIFTTNGEKNATILSVYNFFDYHFDGGSGKVSYSLLGMESAGTQTLEDGTVVTLPESAIAYFSGNLDIPASVVQQWGESDEIIFSYVASTLNLIMYPQLRK